jgi:predicted MFS family arabinose efflux permease
LPLAGSAGAVGWVGLAALLTSETPAGVGATMTLSGAIFNLGGAAGGALGGLLLYLAGYTALAICLPVFALGSAALVWRPEPASARVRTTAADHAPGPDPLP